MSELRLRPGGRYSRVGSIWEDLECFLVHPIVVYTITYYIVAHSITFFKTTKNDNTAKWQNSLYIGKLYIILLIL